VRDELVEGLGDQILELCGVGHQLESPSRSSRWAPPPWRPGEAPEGGPRVAPRVRLIAEPAGQRAMNGVPEEGLEPSAGLLRRPRS
jgi:hypothetical protein